MTAPVLQLVRPNFAEPVWQTGDGSPSLLRPRAVSSKEGRSGQTPLEERSLNVPNLKALKSSLPHADLTIAFQALQMALTELGDGVTLVWRRQSSTLTGRVKPLFAFRNEDGRICRALTYTLSRAGNETEIKGTACREADGHWAILG